MEINPKTAWWLKHKNDPNIIECMREARRRYYYKNQERLQERGREYYHRRKALTVPPLACPSGQEEPPAT